MAELTKTELMVRLLKEKQAALDFQARKHDDWNETYLLSRGKIKTNRLTQRQAINIPIMKETEKTILSRVDEPPLVEWTELGGDLTKQLYMQSMWDQWVQDRNLEIIDMQDKKTVVRYGRATIKLMPDGNKPIGISALDIYDVVYDPQMNPIDVETARFIIHQNIFRSLRTILADPKYSDKGKDMLKIWLLSRDGIIASEQNKEQWEKKMERLRDMGLGTDKFDSFAGGDTIVNLTEHFTESWNEKKQKFERRVVVYANDSIELLEASLVDLVGVKFWPFVTWADDYETNDIWTDSIDDIVRVPNKLINIWFSQEAENRTLKNFNMHWYDATQQNYKPQTYEPGPGVMLPAPGNPEQTIMPVRVGDMTGNLETINFVTAIIERATGATAIEKGVGESKEQTLGEVQILVGKAMERTTNMAKYYRRARYELAMKWLGMTEANVRVQLNLYRKNQAGKVYKRTIYPSDWYSESGFNCVVRSSSERETEATKGVQRYQFLLQMFPGNAALRRIAQKRSLELVDVTPEELRQIEEDERKLEEAVRNQAAQESFGAGAAEGSEGVNPTVRALQGNIQAIA